ncbi:YPDG domain-containing protein [Schaalia turicensis]|uniref:YPDG domain-containing protein n=1 Tax=Schaalia turicensis TaxID=131111 RepID=UPI003FA40CD2
MKVYAQWHEGVNTEHSSPVYYTESDANGNFTIKMGPYTDALGVTRTFAADASIGLTTGDPAGQRDQRREKIRMWTELPDDLTDKYRLVHQPAAGIFPGIGASTTPTTQGDGQWNGNKVSGVTIGYAQKDKLPQHLPENKWAESVGKSSNYGTYAGRAFWNLDVLQGALSYNAVSAFGGKDVAAAGLKVVGSYLNDQAVTKIEEYAKNNFAGKTLRGSDWTPTDEEGLQRWINEQVAADPEGWIAETVTTTTGADGRFQLFWKGIYGNNHTGTGGGINPPAAKLHKLAGSWEEGSWLNGNLQSKHVNMHWSYLSVLGADGTPLPDNIGVLYPWSLGHWAGPGFGADLNAGANAQLFGGDGVLIESATDGYTGWNIALAPQSLKFDVVDKNTTDNWATVGDTVQTDTSGLPITQDLTYYIQWVDKKGKVVKTCETAKPDAATKIPSCPFTVPAEAQTGDTFTARLKLAGDDPDPEDDLLLALDAFAVAREYLEYNDVQAKAEAVASSDPKFDNPATDAVETKPAKAKFELGTLPEGVTKDQVSVDPVTGVVTFTPNADQVGKTFKFPVMMRNEDLQVPVLDENGDPVKGDDGQPKTQGRVVAHADAPFTVDQPAAKDNEKFEPAYEGKLVVPGDQGTTSAPSFTDATGQGVDVPEDAKFAIGDGFTAPEGYVYNFDPSTGEITVSFPDKSKLNKDTTEAFDVPVKVTYKDGSTDEVKANFKLDTDGDRKPDTEDEDDDNDGIPDGKDSNPKVPNANDHFQPEYTNGSGKPGDQVTVPAPTFKDKDGQGTTAPDGTMFTPGDGTPGGVTIDKNTGEIKVAIPGDAAPGSKIEVPVVVTYPDGTTDNVTVTVTVEQPDQPAAKDNEKFEPAYEGKLVVPGDQGTTSAPSFTDATGRGVDVPEDAKFAIGDGFTAPEGYVYNFDPSTGEITVSFPDKSKLNKDTTEAFDVPVKVTYKDGSTDEVKANFKLDTDGDRKPDTEDEDDDNDGIPDGKDSNPKVPNANDHFQPEYTNGSGKPGDQVTVPAPTFKDKDGQGTTAPDGTMFTPGDGTPGGVTIDKNTGQITVDIPGDATPGTKIEVPVVVTYPDGTTDNVTVTVTVTEKDATPVTPGEPTEHNPSLGASADDPADCKMPPFVTVEKTEGVVYKVTVGGVELQPDAEGKYVYEYGQTVKVEASPAQGFTFPAGVKTTWTYTTMQNEICNVPDTKDNEKYQPKYEDGTGKPGDQVTVPAPTFTDKDGKGTTPPADTTFTPGNGTPDGVTIDKNTGQITVDIPGDATPGTKIEVPVVVTYPDGTTDNVTVTVTVGEPDTKTPDWKDGSGEPGGKVVIPNDGGPVEDGTTVDTDGPGKAKIDGDGNLVVDIDDNAKPGDKIVVIVKDKNGNEIDRVTVTVEKPAAGDMTTEPGVKKSKLARTGAQVAGLAGIAAVIGVAGLGLALVRRRREGEEN